SDRYTDCPRLSSETPSQCLSLLLLLSSAGHRDLHSFPTRRSSDLGVLNSWDTFVKNLLCASEVARICSFISTIRCCCDSISWFCFSRCLFFSQLLLITIIEIPPNTTARTKLVIEIFNVVCWVRYILFCSTISSCRLSISSCCSCILLDCNIM